jgi:hypothetical protein
LGIEGGFEEGSAGGRLFRSIGAIRIALDDTLGLQVDNGVIINIVVVHVAEATGCCPGGRDGRE